MVVSDWTQVVYIIFYLEDNGDAKSVYCLRELISAVVIILEVNRQSWDPIPFIKQCIP